MKCWYKKNHPVLRIQPLKVERVWVNPEIFVFRNILSDKYVQLTKDNAFPKVSILMSLCYPSIIKNP